MYIYTEQPQFGIEKFYSVHFNTELYEIRHHKNQYYIILYGFWVSS